MHMVWTIPSGLTWLLIAGCAIAAWVVGYGMGYRRGVRDAITGSIPNTDHRFNGEQGGPARIAALILGHRQREIRHVSGLLQHCNIGHCRGMTVF